MTSLWLHSASQLLVLAALLAAFWITLRAYRWYRRGMKRNSDYSKLIAEASDENWTRRLSRTHTTIADHWPLILVAVTGVSLSLNMWQLYREFHRQNYVNLHNIHVLDRMDDYLFQMDSEDPDTHQRQPFMIRFCPDYEPTREMQAGVNLLVLKYERHDLDNCATISKRSLGYIIERGKDGKPILYTR